MPVSRAGVLALVALTLHYSVLSLVLHISRTTPGARYHASSAIFLTELFKVLVSFGLVLCSGELRPRVGEKKRDAWEEQERRALSEANEPAWLDQQQEREKEDKDEDHRDWLETAELIPNNKPSTSSSLSSPIRGDADNFRFPASSSSSSTSPSHTPKRNPHASSPLRIDSVLAQSKAGSSSISKAPQFAFIPATPVPQQSPVRFPSVNTLYPSRPPLERSAHAVREDVLDRVWWATLKETVFGEGWWKLAAVAALFTLQGNLQYVASGNLTVPLFTLAYQLKIPATAMCSVILLNRVLTTQAWASLFVLTSGVGIVQLYSVAPPAPTTPPPTTTFTHGTPEPNQLIGLLAVVAACASSGFASCFFERILKAPPSTAHPIPKPSIWVRNIQLSMFGLAAGLPVVLWEMKSCLGVLDYQVLDEGWWAAGEWAARTAAWTFFDGFNAVTWMVIFLQVTGGLLGALVVQHADNLLKCFSTSLSILISVIASVFLFNFQLSLGIGVGACMVVASTWIYTNPSKEWRWRPAGIIRRAVPAASQGGPPQS